MVPAPPGTVVGQGFWVKEHTEMRVTLEARMTILLCSQLAYIVFSLTSNYALALGIFHCTPPSYQMTKITSLFSGTNEEGQNILCSEQLQA